MSAVVRVYPSRQALFRAAGRRVVAAARRAVAARGAFSLVLAGGGTPVPLYTLLAGAPLREKVPWAQVHVFWGDERCVPPDHSESNFGMAQRTLLSHVPIPPAHVHRIPGEMPPREAASAYEALLRRSLGAEESGSEPVPRFDLVLLGLGEDGHTASLFPGTSALWHGHWVVALDGGPERGWRVSLTPQAFNAARCICFLVSGQAKAHALGRTLSGPPDADAWPAQAIQPVEGDLVWLVDAEAAEGLRARGR